MSTDTSKMSPSSASAGSSAMEPQILDNLSDGVLAVDADYKILAINAAAERLTGFQRDQVIGRYCYELLRSTRCGDGCPVRAAMKTGEPQRNILVSTKQASGKRRWLCISTSPMVDAQGRVVGGLEILREAACVTDSCCEASDEVEGGGVCSHADRAALIREAEGGHSRPSHRAILQAELRPEDVDGLTAEAEKLQGLLQAHGWNRQRTAEALGISRSTLWRRMKEFGLID
jgi:PAS domain S-box-containing protein